MLLIHRVRKSIVNEQNRVANQLRGLIAEFGVVMPHGLVRRDNQHESSPTIKMRRNVRCRRDAGRA